MTGAGSDYRERALKILPWICARCAREFPASRLRELTVHHKDGNHHNNPPDGSNWASARATSSSSSNVSA